MPWRVFGLVGLLVVVTAFTALNLDHRADVSLGVYTFRTVPVFLTSLISLTLGALLAVPFTLPRQRNTRPVPEHQRPLQITDESDAAPVLPVEDEAVAPAPQAEQQAEPEEAAPAPMPADGPPEPPPDRKARRRLRGRRRKERAE